MSEKRDVRIDVRPGHINLLGPSLITYGRRYAEAALAVHDPTDSRIDPVPYHLACQGLELQLKAFLWLHDAADKDRMKNDLGHKLVLIWAEAKALGLGSVIEVSTEHDDVIAAIGPMYKERRFAYWDIDMITQGVSGLREHSGAIPLLANLAQDIYAAIRSAVLKKA